MPTKDTKIITLRVPNRVNFGDVNLHKFITNLYDMAACGAIEIVNNELVLPEVEEDSEWDEIKDLLHDRNLTIKQLKQFLQRY